MRLPLIFAFCFFLVFNASAQTWEVGGFIGGSGYMGDLNPVKPYKISDLAFGGQVKRNLDEQWSLKLNLMHGRIAADDANSSNPSHVERNINFFSEITETSLQAEFNFFRYSPGSLPGHGTRRSTPYLFTGVGAVFFNPKTNYKGTEYTLHDYATEGEDLSERYKRYAWSIPYGVGYKHNISGNLNLISELGYRTAFTDFLDDVSGKYPNYLVSTPATYGIEGELADPALLPVNGRGGFQRGDFRKRDTYMFLGISLTYTFVTDKCPTF